MIACFSLILMCQLAGEILVRAARVPVPGPVLGFMLLFGVLLLRDRVGPLARGPLAPGRIEGTAKGFLAHMSLLFVPAGVGVVQKLDLIAAHGVAIVAVLAGSVILTMLATVLTFLVVGRVVAPEGDRQ
ncbi:MAG: CidA/LrgA family protein [Xanthobacteraceae bacterium]|nr:CidA/LrgA family protein [Xanthobacteraceae bacterium]